MNEALAALMVAVGIAFGWSWSRSKARERAKRAWRPSPYHSVAIRCRGDACDAVKRISSRRFLPDEAPRLPLAECTSAHCRCSFIHHDDRREEDRRHPYGQRNSLPPPSVGHDRRSGSDRRSATA